MSTSRPPGAVIPFKVNSITFMKGEIVLKQQIIKLTQQLLWGQLGEEAEDMGHEILEKHYHRIIAEVNDEAPVRWGRIPPQHEDLTVDLKQAKEDWSGIVKDVLALP